MPIFLYFLYIISYFCLILLLSLFLFLYFTCPFFSFLFFTFPSFFFFIFPFPFFFTSSFLHIFADNAREFKLKASYFLQIFLGSWFLGSRRNLDSDGEGVLGPPKSYFLHFSCFWGPHSPSPYIFQKFWEHFYKANFFSTLRSHTSF